MDQQLHSLQVQALMICRELQINDLILKSERQAIKQMILTQPEKVRPAVEAYVVKEDITSFRDKARRELGLPTRI